MRYEYEAALHELPDNGGAYVVLVRTVVTDRD